MGSNPKSEIVRGQGIWVWEAEDMKLSPHSTFSRGRLLQEKRPSSFKEQNIENQLSTSTKI